MCAFVKSRSTVLAVDDSIPVQTMIKRILENHYQLIFANNTSEALTTLHQQSVDLMLLDISMPGMDGLELCRVLRGLPNFNHLPIVMLTSRNAPHDQVEGRLSGATEYLTKPFSEEELLHTIEKILNGTVSLIS
ncbi:MULTISPECIES: response regulator [Planktothrix]|jgi:CheY-like chemotaxis protein|uniref:Two-component response regulator n=2 Tax=Planktothrix TaxID=54304 RepID=A0A4P5ZUP3_PLAAG|nr:MULTISPECIES: response regulator [Planktothrix]CAD5931463.1 Response regulator MprA [Planktothrix rubescens]CAC5341011.1 Two-component response regulator [Planktothrix rubescens NIVA-CYA 18]CAD5935452.1 Response regulator MprA [Planktothrix rubescens NIVA-CYA 18]CAH2572110.1 Response regulator MprA [Planktothrix rubescens]GDZ93725.1 two-component response regulator [Planktothrix agardhii CCAP 1459/11A]